MRKVQVQPPLRYSQDRPFWFLLVAGIQRLGEMLLPLEPDAGDIGTAAGDEHGAKRGTIMQRVFHSYQCTIQGNTWRIHHAFQSKGDMLPGIEAFLLEVGIKKVRFQRHNLDQMDRLRHLPHRRFWNMFARKDFQIFRTEGFDNFRLCGDLGAMEMAERISLRNIEHRKRHLLVVLETPVLQAAFAENPERPVQKRILQRRAADKASASRRQGADLVRSKEGQKPLLSIRSLLSLPVLLHPEPCRFVVIHSAHATTPSTGTA